MASRKVQLNVRLTEEWLAKIPMIAEEVAGVLGVDEVSIPDTIMMGLQLLQEWIGQQKASRAANVARLTKPSPEGVSPVRGRPPAKKGRKKDV